jgi:hypothetical protein
MTPTDAEVAGRLAGLIDKTLAEVELLTGPIAPNTRGMVRDAIARGLTDALDLGMWWTLNRSQGTSPSSPVERQQAEETRRATRPGYLRPKR